MSWRSDGQEQYRAAVPAHICYNGQRFGRFFHDQDDVYSLVAELAAFYPPYRRVLTRLLIDHPEIHKLSLRARFKKFIHEPWIALRESHPDYVTTPPVIFLRFNSAKRLENGELFRLIYEFAWRPLSSPLVWIISINPKLRLPIQDIFDPLAPYHYIRLPICYDEASADTALILHHKFGAFRRRRRDMFQEDEVWPLEEQMTQLIKIVSGLFEFVDVIIQFVDWTEDGGPRAHLATFLAYMVDSPSPSYEQPYCALDHFYKRALSNTPPDVLAIVKKAFGLVCYFQAKSSPSLDFADIICALSLSNDKFLPYLKRLVMNGVKKSRNRGSRVCFRRFIEDPRRSGKFYTPKLESQRHTIQAYLDILSQSSKLSAILKPQAVQWIEVDKKQYIKLTRWLRRMACIELCDSRHPDMEWVPLLRDFDFRCLAYNSDYFFLHSFVVFLRRLHQVSPLIE
jgi:hypothetical protein